MSYHAIEALVPLTEAKSRATDESFQLADDQSSNMTQMIGVKRR